MMREEFFIKTEHLGLRLLEEEDAAWYSQWFNDSEVCQYNSHHRFPKSVEAIKEYVRNACFDNTLFVLAVIELGSGIHIGNISLQAINYIDRNAEIAFLFGEKEYWNKGYACEAAGALIKHAFDELNLHRVYLGTAENNVGMRKVALKLGFEEEGRRRQAIFKSGEYHDVIEYGKINEN